MQKGCRGGTQGGGKWESKEKGYKKRGWGVGFFW